jgi:aspartyl protease family protein
VTEDQTIGLIWGVVALGMVLSSLTVRQLPFGTIFRYLLGWVGIFSLFYVGFLFRDELGEVWSRARADLTGEPAVTASGDAIEVRMRDDGHFWVTAETEFGSSPMLIDSGATTTVLSRATAQALGASVDDGFPVLVETANGTIRTQRGRIGRLVVGSISVVDLPVLVSDSDDINVIGMNWLNRMARWDVQGRVMTITPP